MSMVSVNLTQVSVACDPVTGIPRVVRAMGDAFEVLGVERVRDETKAYPISIGPRTVFVVRTATARLRLAFAHRDRRWTVLGVDATPEAAGLAA